MVVKAKAPQEDAETRARREQAEDQARDRQIRGIREDVSRETASILRRFGSRAAMNGAPGISSLIGSITSAGGSGSSGTSASSVGGFSRSIGGSRFSISQALQ